jgi:hypothetical protein
LDTIAARTEPPAQLDEFCDSEFELLDRDPKYLPETCRAAIERYPIRAIGTRPEDYMAHNLIRRTLNDARLDRLRGAWQKPPDWALARVSELPGAGSPGRPTSADYS